MPHGRHTSTTTVTALLLAVLGTGLRAGPGRAQESPEELARALSRERAEVEGLQATLTSERARFDAELRSLADQDAELQVLVQREELRLETLRDEIDRLSAEARERSAEVEALEPVVLDGIAALRGAVADGLPFRLDERLAELDDIGADVRAGALDPRAAASRAWRFVEGEIALGAECGLATQPIPLDGEPVLVRVAHLGTVALYFQTEDGRVGAAVPTPQGPSFEVLHGEAARAVRSLFTSFDRQVRSGAFRLPLPAPDPADASSGREEG